MTNKNLRNSSFEVFSNSEKSIFYLTRCIMIPCLLVIYVLSVNYILNLLNNNYSLILIAVFLIVYAIICSCVISFLFTVILPIKEKR